MRKQKILLLVSLNLLSGLGLTGCGDIISDVINAIASEAMADVEEADSGFQGPSSKAHTMVGVDFGRVTEPCSNVSTYQASARLTCRLNTS